MDITIGNILGFLMILFVINGLAVGLGIADDSWSNKINVFTDGTTMYNVESKYQSDELAIIGTVVDEDVNSATTDSTIISGVPFTSSITTQGTTFWNFLKGMTLGYAAIIFLLPIGMAMQWVLIGLIGFIQFGAIIYLLLYLFSIIRGGGGI